MRIYNGTDMQIDLPLIGGDQRLTIPSHSVTTDFMPNAEFLSMVVGSYNYDELALIVSGPFEISMCSKVSGSVGFVVQSLDEAIERFTVKKGEPIEVKEVEEVKVPEPVAEEAEEEIVEKDLTPAASDEEVVAEAETEDVAKPKTRKKKVNND